MKKIALLTACSIGALHAMPASAQTAGEIENDGYADEAPIIVTANRTESVLSETPLAITAISGDALADEQIADPTDLDEIVPNLSITRGNGLQITIRGITSNDNTEKGDPSAAFNVNGIYIARPQQQEVSFYDVERVEVLRGPQGTLYGRNATAGVVNVISVRPKFEFGAGADVNYGSFNKLAATGIVNVPAGENTAFRLAGNIDRRDSYVIDGAPNDGVEYGRFKDNKSARLSALFDITPDFSVYIVGDYSHQSGDNVNTIVSSNFVPATNFYPDYASTPPLTNALYNDSNSDAQRTNPTPFAQQPSGSSKSWGITGEAEYAFGDAALTYLGGYRKADQDSNGVLTNGARLASFQGEYKQQSHELRLAYDSGPLKAQGGLYYFKEDSDIALNIPLGQGANVPLLSFIQGPTSSKSTAAFGEITYELATNLNLTGGLRYTKDKKSRTGMGQIQPYTFINSTTDIGATVGNPIIITNNVAERSFDKLTWRVGLDYQTELGLIYATASTGYKAGGFNDGCLAGTLAGCTFTEDFLYYEPENLRSYEAGFKFQFSRQFALNGNLFHYDYSNIQLTELVLNLLGPGQNGQITTNAAKAKVDGVELDAVIRPDPHWTFNLAANYLNARYTTFNPGRDLSGRPLTRSPKYSVRAAVNYELPLASGGLNFGLATRMSSGYDLSNDFSTYRFVGQPSFTKTDASITYKDDEDRYFIGAYVENIEDDLVVTTNNAPQTVIFADPRTYGVRAGVKF